MEEANFLEFLAYIIIGGMVLLPLAHGTIYLFQKIKKNFPDHKLG